MYFKRTFVVLGMVLGLVMPTLAQATLTVTPLPWKVIGLDSNSAARGFKNY